MIMVVIFKAVMMLMMMRSGVMVITTPQLHSTKAELRFCADLNPAHNMLEIHNSESLWQWSQL